MIMMEKRMTMHILPLRGFICLSLLMLLPCGTLQAQESRKSLSECIEIALKNNLQMQAAELGVRQARALQGTAFNPDKTDVSYRQDPLTPDWIDKTVSISQSFEFPTVYAAQGKMLKEETRLVEAARLVLQNEITKSVSAAYFNLCRALQIAQLWQQQDTLYNGFIERATVRFNAGETNRLELMNAQSHHQENRLQLGRARADLANCQLALQKLLNVPDLIAPAPPTPPQGGIKGALSPLEGGQGGGCFGLLHPTANRRQSANQCGKEQTAARYFRRIFVQRHEIARLPNRRERAPVFRLQSGEDKGCPTQKSANRHRAAADGAIAAKRLFSAIQRVFEG
ncbi:cobalt-zinc-cadmium resistance protein CzcA [Candidatus Symbiothrix dinenymphae]|nr:cobalt-zinc-cadmium resistance protein CzcA [Candidatus Symbiothrix dinenymphae]